MHIPEFQVIKEEQDTYKTNFQTMIEKKTLLKTKLKLLHILAFDSDLKLLEKNHLSVTSLDLSDFKLTESYNLIVPIKNRIMESSCNLKLQSYLIYLSYLYNINFIEIYQNTPIKLYKLFFRINLPEDLRQNLMNLLSNRDGEYFSYYFSEISTPEFRERLYRTSKSLQLLR